MHIIESIGVPHTEVGHIDQSGDLISVYPPLPARLEDTRFVLDQHLGRLAGYLRTLGFDVAHTVPAPDPELAAISSRDDRMLLTRDVGLLKRKQVRCGHFVRATQPRSQLLEIVNRFYLASAIAPFTRCFRCNTLLQPVSKSAVESLLPERVADLHSKFMQCPSCERIYWQGSHYARMQALIDTVTHHGSSG